MKQAKVLTDPEIKRLTAIVSAGPHPARNALALMLSHQAGLRVGEIASLTWGDVLTAEGQVRDRIHLKGVKTKGGVARTVFLNKRLQRQIQNFLSGLQGLPSPYAPLIRSQKGKAFSANSLCQLFAQIYRRAGIDGATSHSGRRGFITKLAHSGVSPKVIMELARHKHLGTTQRYIDVDDYMKRSAVEII